MTLDTHQFPILNSEIFRKDFRTFSAINFFEPRDPHKPEVCYALGFGYLLLWYPANIPRPDICLDSRLGLVRFDLWKSSDRKLESSNRRGPPFRGKVTKDRFYSLCIILKHREGIIAKFWNRLNPTDRWNLLLNYIFHVSESVVKVNKTLGGRNLVFSDKFIDRRSSFACF